NRWMHRYDVRLPVNACDRRDVADEIETELVIERRVDGVPTADYEQRVAVRRCAHDRLGADIAARAWSILDDERLTEPLRQPLTHQTRDDVARTGRSERHDDAHRPRWIGLRPSDPRHGRQRGSARGQMQEFATGKFHGLPLPSHHSITSSARASSVGGMSMRSDFAVWRLMSNWNLVGCWTGSSAGVDPL